MAYNPYSYPGYTQNISSGTTDLMSVPWVSSIQEVESTRVPYGKQLFMDRNHDYFYVKDYTGLIKCYRFEEAPPPSTYTIQDTNNFVTKQEFDELRQKYEQLIAASTDTTATQPTQSNEYSQTNAAVQWNTGASQATVLQSNSTDGADTFATQQPS